ncbi:MAG: ABC transporter substrate-binding protein [Candidatus Binatia bacterium]
MKAIVKTTMGLGILMLTALIHWTSAVAQETASQVLAKLSKLPPDKRQQVLAEKAKAEGEVTFYSSLQAAQIDPFVRVFNKRYPFIKVNTYRASGQKQIIKIQTELKANRNTADVINGGAEQAASIKSIGALDAYHSPQREFYPAEFKDKEGYFTSFYITTMVLGYNTNLVKHNEAPKIYEDLLNPKWKGNMFLDDEAFEWFAVLLRHYGREKGLQFMKRLAQQDLSMQRGRTGQTQLLVAGERAIGIYLSGHTVLDLKDKGAPLGWVALDPYFAQANMLMLARHAPHPHAAALFMDWALSEEGQAMITTFGRVVARNGVKQRFPELMEKKSSLVDTDMIGPILSQTSKEFREIFLPNR